MQRRTRTVKVYTEKTTDGDSDELSPHTQSASEDETEEWQPESKAPKRQQKAQPSEKKPAVKRQAKPKEPKESKPKVPRKPVERKPRAPRAPKAPRAPRAPKAPKPPKTPKPPKEPKPPKAPRATKGGKKQQALLEEEAGGANQTNSICDAAESQQSGRVKEERLSFIVPDGSCNDNMSRAGGRWSEGPSSSHQPYGVKKEEPEEDFAFDEPSLKRQKTSSAPQGRPTRLPTSGRAFGEDLNMNWDLIQLLSERTGVEQWVCLNISQLFREENTIPFIVRYRKEMINHMDADAVRDVQLVLEEIHALAKKTQTISQTLKKEGVLTAELEQALRNCRTADELDHVYAPYKKGSKLSKACRAKQLGLESAAQALLQSPRTLDLRAWVKPGTEGLSTVEEVSTGVEQILADMIAKDGESLTHIRSLCDNSMVMLQSSVSKTALKEQQKEGHQGKPKDIDKFHLYCDFTCSVQRIQHHQTLAINRGENLKILTVKVNIPDCVKSDFCGWCLNVRWKPNGYTREELMKILRDAVEDSYKRLLFPLLSRSYRTKLTVSAEKESIAMFVRNLRQRLLVCPVRGRVIMGVDPGFRHGCKLAILSPTSQILFTDVVYLHGSQGNREADKLRHLMIRYSCNTVVIGNGTACRETEAFFADLISRRFFQPLDVSYCITSEAGASIYSVSPAAVKEMPDLDPNLRSAVSIGRRVQDPLAELVKIDPKHIGIGTYQHDVSQSSLKAALDGVVQECVSFVGVDINICSETLMRHVAGLNIGRAKSIAEWRETNGPFMNRDQLRLVKGLGPKSYQQCAGFIRINPLDHLNNHSDAAGGNSAQAAQEKPAAKGKGKGKTKASAAVPTLPNPLDQTCIHPESYAVARSFLSLVGGSVDQMGRPELRQCVEASVKCQGLEALAETLNTTPDTLQLIIDGLTQPPGFDIRQDFEKADFKRGIVSMSDLREGVVLTGRVENATLFGAFVDIGVGRNGLIHKRYITPDKLPADQRRRSLALGPGEKVEVRVLNVDPQRGRIGLDLIRVLR